MSHLFNFEVNLIADLTKDVRFENIIGQSVTVEMRLLDGDQRYFNGIVRRFRQGARDEGKLNGYETATATIRTVRAGDHPVK